LQNPLKIVVACNLWNKISQIYKNVIGNNSLDLEVGENAFETAMLDYPLPSIPLTGLQLG